MADATTRPWYRPPLPRLLRVCVVALLLGYGLLALVPVLTEDASPRVTWWIAFGVSFLAVWRPIIKGAARDKEAQEGVA